MSDPQQTLTIQQAIDLAVQHHNAGRLPKAEDIYQQILQSNPKQPVALHLRGVIAHQMGKSDIAVDLITRALAIKPDLTEAHNNLGLVLQELGKLEEAVGSYHKALTLKPDLVEAHNNLGNALKGLGKPEEAMASYRKALAIKPDYAEAHNNLGEILLGMRKFDEALQAFETVDTPNCRAAVLECLFSLSELDKFYEMQTMSMEKDKTNIRAAAISAFASQQLNQEDPHPFCKKPMNFVRIYKGLNGSEEGESFRQNLIDELRNKKSVWEPLGKATKQGFQTPTSINLFRDPTGPLAEAKKIVKDTIEKYHQEFSSENCGFIKWFPRKLTLKAWFVRLLQKGHQTEHIHPSGWLSGVFYLQVPEFSDQEEGCIEVGLRGGNYPVLNKNYPKKRYFPKNGDIILFPSSLFHRTIPFHSDEERMCIAFDLIPHTSEFLQGV